VYSVESQPTLRNTSPPSSGFSKPSKIPACKQITYSACSTLKMEAICSSETSADFQRSTRRYITEDGSTLHNHRRENRGPQILNRRVVGCDVFYAMRIVSKGSRRLVLI
jgi:hypothetical protein